MLRRKVNQNSDQPGYRTCRHRYSSESPYRRRQWPITIGKMVLATKARKFNSAPKVAIRVAQGQVITPMPSKQYRLNPQFDQMRAS